MKGPDLFQADIISKQRKFSDNIKKKSSFPELLDQFNQNWHPWVIETQVRSIEGTRPFPRDNFEIGKYIDEIKKSYSPEPLSKL